jgi:hypothetical protein
MREAPRGNQACGACAQIQGRHMFMVNQVYNTEGKQKHVPLQEIYV